MKKTIVFIATFLFSTVAYSDYGSHRWLSAPIEKSECITAGIEGAKSIGIDAKITKNSSGKITQNAVVYGMDNEGYSIQFSCLQRHGLAYFFVNGAHSAKRGEKAETVNKAVKEFIKKLKK